MRIVKSNGSIVEFNANKIRETLLRIGAKPWFVEQVLKNVLARIQDGMSTAKVFTIVQKELRKENRSLAHRYNLRQSLLKLGPAGFKFEQYIAAILEAYGYKATLPPDELRGLCVKHEVDVIAERGDKRFMIEAKFRNKFDDVVTLKDTLATWARFIDLNDGAKAGLGSRFDEAWIVTNGRFSERSLQFGSCKGMRLTGWSGSEQSFAKLVDHAALYPITILEDIKDWELDTLAQNKMLLCRQIANETPEDMAQKTKIPEERARKIISDCHEAVALPQ